MSPAPFPRHSRRSGGRSGFISPSLDLEEDLQPGLADDVYNAAIGLGEMTVPAARPLEDPRRPAVSLGRRCFDRIGRTPGGENGVSLCCVVFCVALYGIVWQTFAASHLCP